MEWRGHTHSTEHLLHASSSTHACQPSTLLSPHPVQRHLRRFGAHGNSLPIDPSLCAIRPRKARFQILDSWVAPFRLLSGSPSSHFVESVGMLRSTLAPDFCFNSGGLEFRNSALWRFRLVKVCCGSFGTHSRLQSVKSLGCRCVLETIEGVQQGYRTDGLVSSRFWHCSACSQALVYPFRSFLCVRSLSKRAKCRKPDVFDDDCLESHDRIDVQSNDYTERAEGGKNSIASSLFNDCAGQDKNDTDSLDSHVGRIETGNQQRFMNSATPQVIVPGIMDEEDIGNRKEIELTWLQTRLVECIRPFVRVVNGSALKKSKEITTKGSNKPLGFVSILNGTEPSIHFKRKLADKLRQIEADFLTFSGYLGQYIFIMMATGTILATGYQLAGGDSQQEMMLWCSWLAGVIIGSMIGAGKVMERHFRSKPRNVVITGSTRGLGKALAREFVLAGDRVVIASRSSDSVGATVIELQKNSSTRRPDSSDSVAINKKVLGSIRYGIKKSKVVGMACDVSKVEDVRALGEFAIKELGSIDIWINNAGVNKGFRPLVQISDEDIWQIVSANLIGSLICSREAIRLMKQQAKGGHIFNMDGAGSFGSSTPLTAVYGSTKSGLHQLHASLLNECKRTRVGIHTASPGMVLTDLLLSGASLQNKKMFNIICELPETVAGSLVPRMREVKGTGKAINYLTPPRILFALVTSWLRHGRWFDEEGKAVYAAEADRVRNWAENRTRFSVSAAMDQFSDVTWVSVFSISVICAFIILSSTGNEMPGT
eukprot:c28185_g1_i1 orf=157-2463(+)